MGNQASTPAIQVPPSVQPTPVITLPMQRDPVLDGASGLHYSGRVYTNDFAALGKDICQGATVSVDQINDVMPNSISNPGLPVDATTHRISSNALQAYIANLQSTGAIPGQSGTLDQQMAADRAFYAAVQAEYCFYETRYKAALAEFLTQVSAPQPTTGGNPTLQIMLATTVTLNNRLNSLLEIMNYVANERASRVNLRSPQIDAANATLEQKIAVLNQQKDFLEGGQVRKQTQEEMMRYSAEKSRAMNIQIMFFVALNVVALGTVLTVYRSAPAS